MRSLVLALVCSVGLTAAACGSSGGGAPCSPTVLLDGGQLPAAQGWASLGAGTGVPASTDGTHLTVDTSSMSSVGSTGPFQLYGRDIGLLPGTAMNLEWRLRVVQADPHNPQDAGVAFLASYTSPFGLPAERSQMLYFEEGAIGWADGSATYAIDTTVAHLYRLEIDAAGGAHLLVDGAPALSRSGLTLSGTIGFGDQTNDPGVDGAFVLDFIRRACP